MSTTEFSAEAAEASAAAMSAFAAGVFEAQPFRGYELRDCLASCDRSAVFKAFDRNMERNVAVKVMRPFSGREGVVEDFFSLAGSIARLRCPGAARGLDAGRGDGNFFLVYEFVAGESLAAKLARRQAGRLTEKESLRLMRELAGVLQSLFEAGHPHGHFTPGNVMLGEGGKAKLLDIGFAWNLAWPDDQAAFVAAPDFPPPERIRGDLNIDIRGDLYSLGAVWYWLLLGEPPFRASTPEETLRRHLEEKPRSPRDLDPRLSAATSNLILWLLEKERDARPRTPREFLRKLRSHPLLVEEGTEGAAPDEGAEADIDEVSAAAGPVEAMSETVAAAETASEVPADAE